jgi:tRNA(Ile)-lysidine synthase
MRRLVDVENVQPTPWNMKQPLVIEGIGILKARKSVSQGLAKKFVNNGDMQVRFREGGELIQPVGRQGHHALKKLFQESGVPPWVRERTPLIFIKDQLAAVGEMFISQQFCAANGEDAYIFQWESWGQLESARSPGL